MEMKAKRGQRPPSPADFEKIRGVFRVALAGRRVPDPVKKRFKNLRIVDKKTTSRTALVIDKSQFYNLVEFSILRDSRKLGKAPSLSIEQQNRRVPA